MANLEAKRELLPTNPQTLEEAQASVTRDHIPADILEEAQNLVDGHYNPLIPRGEEPVCKHSWRQDKVSDATKSDKDYDKFTYQELVKAHKRAQQSGSDKDENIVEGFEGVINSRDEKKSKS